MFEGIFRNPAIEKSLEQREMDKKENRAKVGLAIGAAALAADIALQPDIHDLHRPNLEETKKITTENTAKPRDAIEGKNVTIDLKQNIITMKPLGEAEPISMRPPGDTEPVSIDLTQKITTVKFPEVKPVSVDLSAEKVSVDLTQKIVSMEPPTNPHPERQ